MKRYLVISVRTHDGRYHGEGDEFPSPFRLFQAMVAGAGLSGPLDDYTKEALAWLEKLDPPIIASPRMIKGQTVYWFVPNNDLDKFHGDARNIAKTRGAKKVWRPRIFDSAVPWIYAWPFTADGIAKVHAEIICKLSEKLYQLGRGVDMAWAWGKVLSEEELDETLSTYSGIIKKPSVRGNDTLACPTDGSLKGLIQQHEASRFMDTEEPKKPAFVKRSPPQFQIFAYDSPPTLALFALRDPADTHRFAPWPLDRIVSLVEKLRDAAVDRLKRHLPQQQLDIERVLVGRKPDRSNAGPKEDRIRIVPLPSIGHHHADRAIRRVLIEVPPTCPLRPDDVFWAFSNLDVVDKQSGEIIAILTRLGDDDFLHHYGLDLDKDDTKTYCSWRTITPAVLPDPVARDKIGVFARLKREAAASAVIQALRHAGIRCEVNDIQLQRESFESRGTRAEPFAIGTRFHKDRLWHVAITFKTPLRTPLTIGDGRFLGLGLMAPIRHGDDLQQSEFNPLQPTRQQTKHSE